MEFIAVLFVAVALIEAIIEAITMLVENFDIKMVYAGVLGMLFTYLFQIDLLGFLSVDIVFKGELALTITNVILLGLVFLRHSGNLNDLLEWVKGLRSNNE